MREIKTASQFNKLAKDDKPLFLDFYADWCGPCQSLLPVVEKLAEKHEGSVHIRKVNVDKFPALAQKFNVKSIPALFILRDQKIIDKAVGFQSENTLEKMIKKAS